MISYGLNECHIGSKVRSSNYDNYDRTTGTITDITYDINGRKTRNTVLGIQYGTSDYFWWVNKYRYFHTNARMLLVSNTSYTAHMIHLTFIMLKLFIMKNVQTTPVGNTILNISQIASWLTHTNPHHPLGPLFGIDDCPWIGDDLLFALGLGGMYFMQYTDTWMASVVRITPLYGIVWIHKQLLQCEKVYPPMLQTSQQ